MAYGDYSGVALLDVIEELGRDDLGQGFSEFQRKDKGNLSVLRCFTDNMAEFYDETALRQALDKKTSPSQDVFVDVMENVNPGTGTQLRRGGTGGADRNQMELVPSPMIEEGFAISSVNEMLSRFSNYSTEKRVQYTLKFLMAQAFQNIALRLDALCYAYLGNNLWANGGIGTIYPNTGNFKIIPATEDEKLFLKIETEAMQNKFGSFFDIVGNSYTHYLKRLTEAYGQYNQINTAPSTQNHRFYISNRVETPDPLTQDAVFYMISRGGIGVMTHCYKIVDTESFVQVGQDTWMVAAMPPLPILEGINTDLFHVLIKGYNGFADNFATYANEPSRIDLVQSISISCEPYIMRSYSDNARRPIVGYIVDKPA